MKKAKKKRAFKLGYSFSNVFDIDEEIIGNYGAIDINLLNDLPLFIDPFLLFNSEKKEYQEIHQNIIKYLLYVKNVAVNAKNPSSGMLKSLMVFSEVKETWLGFSLSGNLGRGMGIDFAKNLFEGLRTTFIDFGKESLTESSHLEKFCLLGNKIGRDKISDFTTNFSKEYLLEYTEKFAKEYMDKKYCKEFRISRVRFNYDTKTWVEKTFYLPEYDGNYVILTPKDILTRDDTFINKNDMYKKYHDIVASVDDDEARYNFESYLNEILSSDEKPKKKNEKRAIDSLIRKYPEYLDYYIKYKEDNGEEAVAINEESVHFTRNIFEKNAKELVSELQGRTGFYNIIPDAVEETKKRIEFLKDMIENKDGYKFFYYKEDKPIKRESDLQLLFRLVWFNSDLDVNREVNNGRGPVDYKISYGAKNSVLVEFKLASNSKLKKNLENQVQVYKKASNTKNAIKVIMYFNDKEQAKLQKVLNDLKLKEGEDVFTIDARKAKPSASNVG